MRIINTIKQKIKSFIDRGIRSDVYWVVTIIVAILASFSLGMIYERKLQSRMYSVHIEHQDFFDQLWEGYRNQQNTGNYFASKNGTKLYPVGCKAGNRILQENRVFFQTLEQARSLGYEMSSQC